jgi:hypothetical protein
MTQNERGAGRRRWARVIAGAAAMAVVAVAGPVLTAPPAAAATVTTIHPEWVDGCPGCPGPWFTLTRVLDERVIVSVNKSVQAGLSQLLAAQRAADPSVAKRLRAQAATTLRGGAAQAGNGAWAAGDWDGDLCPRRPWPFPGPGPQWNANEKVLAEGMTQLSRGNISGDTATINAGMRNLDAGVAGLTAFQGCV